VIKVGEAASEVGANLLVLLALLWAFGMPAGFIHWTSQEAPLRAVLSIVLPCYGLASTLWCLLLG
jgi:hypothetical protein